LPSAGIPFFEGANVPAGTKPLSHTLASINTKADERPGAKHRQHCVVHWPAHLDQGIGVSPKIGNSAGSGENQIASGHVSRVEIKSR
jgi:hypothetical protein